MTSVSEAVRSACSWACGSGAGTSMPGLGRELLDRIHERHAAIVGEEADRVAVRAAAEAMVEALVVVDGEARRLLVVERAARLPLAPGADQLHRRRDHRAEASSERAVRRARRGRGSRNRPYAANRRPQAARRDLSTGRRARRCAREYLTAAALDSNDSFRTELGNWLICVVPTHGGARSLSGITREGFIC